MSWDNRLVMAPDYRHATFKADGLSVAELRERYRDGHNAAIHVIPTPTPVGSLGLIPEADFERLETWMAWKHTEALRARLTAQVEKASKRGSRGTTVALGDLAELLALVDNGGEPK